MAPHSSPLAWKIPWTEERHRLQSMGSSQTRLSNFTFHFSLSCIGEGNGNPLRCSCLENPRDGGAWWATVYGVTQSQTRLKGLSSSSSSNSFLLRPTLTSIHDHWKNNSLDYTDLCWLLNMLSRLVITFLPRSKHLLISWLQSPSAVIWSPPN